MMLDTMVACHRGGLDVIVTCLEVRCMVLGSIATCWEAIGIRVEATTTCWEVIIVMDGAGGHSNMLEKDTCVGLGAMPTC